MTSIKSVEILTIDKEYIRDKFLPSSNPSQKEKERRQNLTDSNRTDSDTSKTDVETPENLTE
jgi:hypothetical protein